MRGKVVDSKIEKGKLIIVMEIQGEKVYAEVSDPEVIDNLQADCSDWLCSSSFSI